MNKHIDNERGIALLISLIAVVVVGGLLVGVSVSARLEHRQAQNTGAMAQAMAVGELGLNETIANFNNGGWNALAITEVAAIAGASMDGAGSYTGTVTRLNQRLYLVNITGTSARGSARQRLGSFVKMGSLDIEISAAAKGGGGGGQAVLKGGVTVDGRDRIPLGWGPMCSSPLEDKAGIEWKDDNLVVVEPGGTLDGAPPLVEDPTINGTNVFEWGSLNFDDLAAMADIEIPTPSATSGQINPQVAGGVCDTAPWENWGAPEDPSSPCFDYFPIIHRPGPLTLTSGTGVGQGILLVDGELTIEGDFHFYGLVIVKGEIQMKGNVQITGAVIAGAQLQSEPGDLIQYSQCAVARALSAGGGSAAALRSRAWLQMFAGS